MIHIVTSQNRHLYENQLDQMWRQRYDIFVTKMGWDLPAKDDREIDTYDTDDCVYILVIEDGESVRGSMRLIPTAGPHILGDLFPELCEETPPCALNIWESSRGHVYGPKDKDDAQKTGAQLFAGMLETGLLFGMDHVVFVIDPAMLPSLTSVGWSLKHLGMPQFINDDHLIACSVSITSAALMNVRKTNNLTGPVTYYRETGDHPLQMADIRLQELNSIRECLKLLAGEAKSQEFHVLAQEIERLTIQDLLWEFSVAPDLP